MQSSSESSLQARIEAIWALAEQLRSAPLENSSGHRAAILAMDRLCDAVVTARWEMLQTYRARYGHEVGTFEDRPPSGKGSRSVPPARAAPEASR